MEDRYAALRAGRIRHAGLYTTLYEIIGKLTDREGQ